ncbi:MAG: transposase, partial [Microcystaceae cyanobacterium]
MTIGQARKGKTYGTILVDLEKRRPIALLANREAETLSQWLKEHPGVKLVTRDRSIAYRQGITQGSPESVQVADRFHLLQNLAEALEGVFNEHLQELKAADAPSPRVLPEVLNPLVSLPSPEREKADIVHAEACRTRRLANYDKTHELHRQGWTNGAIACHIGISEKTVYRFLLHRTFPERQENRNRGHSRLDPYKTYLLERWNSGCHHSKLLWQEVAAKGCRSSYGSVARFLRSLKEAQGLKVSPDAQVLVSRRPQLTPRRAAWLVLRRKERRSEEDED